MNREIVINQIVNNNRVLCKLLKEESEDDEILFNIINQKRKPTGSLFSMRKSEGFFEKLIKEHLSIDDNKFREFFRLNRQQFYFILSLVKEPLTKEPALRVPDPITPDEKLAVTLR